MGAGGNLNRLWAGVLSGLPLLFEKSDHASVKLSLLFPRQTREGARFFPSCAIRPEFPSE